MTRGPSAFQVQVDCSIPNLLGHLIDGPTFPDAGIANQKVNPLKAPDGGVNQTLGVAGKCNISLNCQRADTCTFGFSNSCRRGPLITSIVDNDIGAELREAVNGRAPNPARPARYDGDSIF